MIQYETLLMDCICHKHGFLSKIKILKRKSKIGFWVFGKIFRIKNGHFLSKMSFMDDFWL